jgi:hypothetical protein
MYKLPVYFFCTLAVITQLQVPVYAGCRLVPEVIIPSAKNNSDTGNVLWKKYLAMYLTMQQAKTPQPEAAVFSPENTRFFTASITAFDSLLVVETSVESGSAGPQIVLLIFRNNSNAKVKFQYSSYGFINGVEKKENGIIIRKYNRGYNWEPLLSEIMFKNNKVTEQAISRGGIPVEILRLLTNIGPDCKKAAFDCGELYGTVCDTISTTGKRTLVFVYNAEKAPWFFAPKQQIENGKEILGYMYLKTGSIVRNVATVLNTDTIYMTNSVYNKMPVLAAKTGAGETLYYIFNGKEYNISGEIQVRRKIIFQKIIFNK